jgi:hypothetical protein
MYETFLGRGSTALTRFRGGVCGTRKVEKHWSTVYQNMFEQQQLMSETGTPPHILKDCFQGKLQKMV